MAVCDTTQVRGGEEVDVAALASYLGGKIDGFDQGIRVEQFPSGHSNLTYLLRTGEREYVLRRAPLGPVAPKAHDMAREYRVLAAVHPHFPESPKVYLLCEDPAVIGAAFFVMERRRGMVLRDQVPAELAAVPDFPRRVSEAFVDCLVRLHAIDVTATGLNALGKSEGYLERQVRGWAERWTRVQTEEIPETQWLIQWLGARLPAALAPSLIHNDFKLDNVMLARQKPDHIEAVLDWEMATVGDPLSDLGLTLCYWSWSSAPEFRGAAIPGITSQPGWFSRDQFVQRYAERTGRDMTNLPYHEVLGVFKLAVILQQIYYRFQRGQTHDDRFRSLGERSAGLMRLAASMAEKHR